MDGNIYGSETVNSFNLTRGCVRVCPRLPYEYEVESRKILILISVADNDMSMIQRKEKRDC